MREGEPLLKDSWDRKVEAEIGESRESEGVSLFYDFKERARKDAVLGTIVEELERRIGDYADAVIHHGQLQVRNEDIGTIKAANGNRTMTHDALIIVINQLSRAYHMKKLDNTWRRDIIGVGRAHEGAWALAVARDVLGKKFDD